jgi:hypothetical protein
MSKAVTSPSLLVTHQSTQTDDLKALHPDSYGDDVKAVSLVGLAVEVELPRELDAPPKADMHVRTVSA